MIKGISRRVIVVRSPDAKLFEQAIFILRDDAFNKSGTSADEVIREACLVADQYVRKTHKRKLSGKWVTAALFSAAGAALTASIWFLSMSGLF